MTMTLTEFLLARIADDETAVASLLAHADWWPKDGRPDPDLRTPFVRVGHWQIDPARVLAECEAKRRIVGRFADVSADSEEFETDELAWHEQGLFEAATFLALPYADHPDYREEWKP